MKRNSSVKSTSSQESLSDAVENLNHFMHFLEEKRIIDPKNYDNEKEAQKLIKDLMKLDLDKFNKDI